jgi:hypothetical protein
VLTVQIPPNHEAERLYIISVLLGEFLGLEYQVKISGLGRATVITHEDRHLSIVDCFFPLNDRDWIQPASLPQQPLRTWQIDRTPLQVTTINSRIPVIYGDDPDDPKFFEQINESIHLGLDIFGSSFFMLTRYEEVVKSDRDKLDRFPASASLAYQEGFLDRPIVNEYLEILWSCLQLLWPALRRKQHHFAICVSHDLDEPFLYAGTGMSRLLQRCAGDIVRRRSVSAMGKTIADWYRVVNGKPELDPYNTFDLIMNISEANNLKSAFYLITDRSADSIDGFYNIRSPSISNLLKQFHTRGHEIGLHTSYNTYQDPDRTKKEFEILRQVCDEVGVRQSHWGGRQHYLRWATPMTFQNWEDAGLDYDSTLVYPEHIGFRCGTCYEYSVFNISNKEHLKLKERPLSIMEVTIFRQAYMGLNISDGSAFFAMNLIKDRCKMFNGLFTLLWHNTSFIDTDELNLYCQIVC